MWTCNSSDSSNTQKSILDDKNYAPYSHFDKLFVIGINQQRDNGELSLKLDSVFRLLSTLLYKDIKANRLSIDSLSSLNLKASENSLSQIVISIDREGDRFQTIDNLTKGLCSVSKAKGLTIYDTYLDTSYSFSQFQSHYSCKQGGLSILHSHVTTKIQYEDSACIIRSKGLQKFKLNDWQIINLSCEESDRIKKLIELICYKEITQNLIHNDRKIEFEINSEDSLRSLDLINKRTGIQAVFEFSSNEKSQINTILFPAHTPQKQLHKIQFALNTYFGIPKKSKELTHSKNLMIASKLALKEIPSIKTQFLAGFPSGQFLFLKFPFEGPNKYKEYIWVHVVSWKEHMVEGKLYSDADKIEGLKKGDWVELHEKDIFDFLIYHTDGAIEGNYTDKIIKSEQ